jgi:hypothetical protein
MWQELLEAKEAKEAAAAVTAAVGGNDDTTQGDSSDDDSIKIIFQMFQNLDLGRPSSAASWSYSTPTQKMTSSTPTQKIFSPPSTRSYHWPMPEHPHSVGSSVAAMISSKGQGRTQTTNTF